MPRTARAAAGFMYHALNRAVARLPLFEKQSDCEAFEQVLLEAQQRRCAVAEERGGPTRPGLHAAAARAAEEDGRLEKKSCGPFVMANVEPILVVEDDQALLNLMRRRLAEHGFSSEGATSGEAALAWLQEHRARLVLLDYNLPQMTGRQLLQRLAARGVQVPFVVVTGHGSETVAVEMMKLGARDYLVKGISFLKLLPTVVSQVLRQLEQERRLAEAEEALRRAHEELERRVQQRTAELAEANVCLREEMEERQRAEQRAHQYQAELAHVARLSIAGEMAAELAHELNQPLSAISAFAMAGKRLLLSGDADKSDELVGVLQKVVEQADRAAEIIRRVRRFVAKAEPCRGAVDLNLLVREIALLVECEARAGAVEMRFDLGQGCAPVLGDRIQIGQVLVNLLLNAIEAMRDAPDDGRRLTICTAAAAPRRVEVAVGDRGVGIPAAATARVFERFFTTKARGMGMGLAISRSIIESHGGRLWFTVNPDRGTTFHFDLPVHPGGLSRGQ